MGKRSKKELTLCVTIHRKHIDRLIIATLLCCNLVSDGTLLSEKVHLGDIAKHATECLAPGSLKDTDNKG